MDKEKKHVEKLDAWIHYSIIKMNNQTWKHCNSAVVNCLRCQEQIPNRLPNYCHSALSSVLITLIVVTSRENIAQTIILYFFLQKEQFWAIAWMKWRHRLPSDLSSGWLQSELHALKSPCDLAWPRMTLCNSSTLTAEDLSNVVAYLPGYFRDVRFGERTLLMRMALPPEWAMLLSKQA